MIGPKMGFTSVPYFTNIITGPVFGGQVTERTRAGLERARAEGKRLGRPSGKKDSKKRRKKRPVVYRYGGPSVAGVTQ